MQLRFSVICVLVYAFVILTGTVLIAQESDLYPVITENVDPARAGEMVDYVVTVTNDGPDGASNPILEVFLPANVPVDFQDYLSGDPGAVHLVDDIFGASITITRGDPNLYYAATCEGFKILAFLDPENTGFEAGATSELTYTLQMPAMPIKNPTVAIEGHSGSLRIGRGACTNCGDISGTCFGPRLSATTASTAPIELVYDSTGVFTDGCEAFIGFAPGNIAWVDRGQCNFETKALNAQQAGAAGIVFGQNVGDDRLSPDGIIDPVCTDYCASIDIPVAFVSKNDNVAVQSMLAAGVVFGTIGAVESTEVSTWANVWENATTTDTDLFNDDWHEKTTIDFSVFIDDFETGDTSSWSDVML